MGISNIFGGFGYAMTSFIFAISINLIVNPDNQNADIVVLEGEGYVHYFSDEIALMMPYWWLYTGMSCIVTGLVCNFLITDNTNTENKFVENIASFINSENASISSEEQKPKS